MKTDLEKLVSECNTKIDSLTKEIKKLETQVTRNANKRDKALLELNSENLKDMGWLIQNPTSVGHYEAMKKMLYSLYGNEFNGPHCSGYTHDKEYNPIQSSFDFFLKVYDKNFEKSKEEKIKNCKHFVENFIQFMKPTDSIANGKDADIPVICFAFRSRHNGIDQLGFSPKTSKWYWFTLIYGNSFAQDEFEDFDTAIKFAFGLAQSDYD